MTPVPDAPNSPAKSSSFDNDDRRHECPHCPYVASTKETMEGHVRDTHAMKTTLKCPHCNYTIDREDFMNTHIELLHDNVENQAQKSHVSASTEGNRTPQRDDSAASSLNETTTSTVSTTRSLKRLSNTVGPPYKCPHCPYTVPNGPRTIDNHVRTCHTTPKAFKCPHCTYSTAQEQHLLLHLKLHDNNDEQSEKSDSPVVKRRRTESATPVRSPSLSLDSTLDDATVPDDPTVSNKAIVIDNEAERVPESAAEARERKKMAFEGIRKRFLARSRLSKLEREKEREEMDDKKDQTKKEAREAKRAAREAEAKKKEEEEQRRLFLRFRCSLCNCPFLRVAATADEEGKIIECMSRSCLATNQNFFKTESLPVGFMCHGADETKGWFNLPVDRLFYPKAPVDEDFNFCTQKIMRYETTWNGTLLFPCPDQKAMVRMV